MKNGYQRALALLLSIMMILALYSGVVTVNAGEVTSGDYTGGEVDPQNPENTCSHNNTTGDWLYNGDGHWHFCTACGQDVDKADHTYEWVVTKEATAQENGLKEEICSVCGYKSGNSEVIVYSGHIPGDIDGNGVSNNLDLILLFQYLSGWDVADQVDMSAVDVDGSGTPNNLDLIALFQHLSGWGNAIY